MSCDITYEVNSEIISLIKYGKDIVVIAVIIFDSVENANQKIPIVWHNINPDTEQMIF